MDNVTFVIVDDVEHAIIDRGNGEFTSMPKVFYDEQQAAHLTQIVTITELPTEPTHEGE